MTTVTPRIVLGLTLLAVSAAAVLLFRQTGAPSAPSGLGTSEATITASPDRPRLEFLPSEPPSPPLREATQNDPVEPESERPPFEELPEGRVHVLGRITDLNGNPLTREELEFLLPIHDPLSSAFDPYAESRGDSDIRAIPDGFERGFRGYQQVFTLGDSRFAIDLPAKFRGRLELVVRDRVIDQQVFAVGDPEPWFQVDLRAIRESLAQLHLRVLGASRWTATIRREDGTIFGTSEAVLDSAGLRDPSDAVVEGIAPGTCVLQICSEEVAFAPRRVELVAGRETIAEFHPVEGGFVRLKLSSSEEAPVLTAPRVRLLSVGVAIASSALPVQSNGPGELRLGPLPAGFIIVTLGANAIEAEVRAGETTEYTMHLQATTAVSLVIHDGKIPPGIDHARARAEVDSMSGARVYDEEIILRKDALGTVVGQLELPPGSYRLRLGLLDGRTIERVFAVDPAGLTRVELR